MELPQPPPLFARSQRARVGILFGALCVARLCAAVAPPPVPENDEAARTRLQFFENEVRPILIARCHECHGEKKQKSGLRLDHISTMLKGGESGPALVRGKPEESLLVTAIRRRDPDLQMPPDDPLPATEVAILEKWIALGAPWPAGDVARSAKGARDEFGFTAEDRSFWSFQPVAQPQPPTLADPAAARWATTELDRFVAARHVELGLQPAPAADRSELARRVYFDVHGLPPTRAQLDSFVNDPAPDAYARLVDSLLASPRYGERWAQHWLDLVRYAESDGYRADAFRPGAWPYRDYVINSLNADKPYDQFVREQLAGDEIAPDNPEVLIATAYLRNPVYEWNQRDVRGQAELIVDDLAANAGEVFLGLSMGCARCHDHKFDPILQKDYFSLRAFFENVLWPTDRWLATADEEAKHAAQQTAWLEATAKIRDELDALTGPALEKNVKRAHGRFTDDIKAMMAKPPAERDPMEQILAVMSERQLQYERDNFDPQKVLKIPAEKARYKELEAELRKFDALKPKPLLPAFIATDTGRTAPPTKMKTRKGEREVAPAFLTLLDPAEPNIAPLPHSTGRRSVLAAWITRPDNPLTSRVIVNRVWQHHFGRGLAGVPNDLGRLGERPTHPELLDWLAGRLVANGWRLKQLHREILLSVTYRQTARIQPSETAARVDPANKFLWRFSPRRLDAEQVRDAVLAASGELDLTAGGPSQDAGSSARRAVYTIKKRNNQNDLLRAMDAPAGFSSIADRQGTSTPLQALLFLNGDWMLARSRTLAKRAPEIDSAWRATLGRAPSADEQRLAEQFIAAQQDAAAGPAGPLVLVPESGMAAAPGRFHENTPHERVLIRNAPKEGDEFTVEAVITADSVDAAAAVRTIVSRWTGEKSSLESHGWSLGLTGQKSAHKPLNLILQLVGEDDNMNTAYEVAPSGIILKLGTSYHVAAKVSCAEGTVTFVVQELGSPPAERRTATVKHSIAGKLGTGQATPVIGGIFRRSPHQFDGRIEGVHITSGLVAQEALSPDPARWPSAGAIVWDAKRPDSNGFEWTGSAASSESADPRQRALADLAHVLLNSNEFIHLH